MSIKLILPIATMVIGALTAGALPAAAATRAQFGAVVDPSGTLLSGNAIRVVFNQDLGGTYYVYFKSAVTGCVSAVSITGTGTDPKEAPAIATVGPTSGAPTSIAVQIRDLTAALVQRGFQLTVTCFK